MKQQKPKPTIKYIMKHVRAKFLNPTLAIALAGLIYTTGAQAATTFQYKIVSMQEANIQGPAQFEALLNKLGADGWELILQGDFLIFKRAQ